MKHESMKGKTTEDQVLKNSGLKSKKAIQANSNVLWITVKNGRTITNDEDKYTTEDITELERD
ncbi:hypothetical protein ACLOJK_022587, partial [Asimina triloba]